MQVRKIVAVAMTLRAMMKKRHCFGIFVTPVGCGIAGFVPEDIAPMFRPVKWLSNVLLPESFWDVLR